MTEKNVGMFILFWTVLSLWSPPAHAVADREKLLTEPGVYGSFATYRLTAEWAKDDQVTRIASLAAAKGVVEQHREKIAIDLYLMRGLSDYADIMFRIHAAELRDTQLFLLDLQASQFGKRLVPVGIMHGLTKGPNYVPGFPEAVKADLKGPSEPGPKPYVIVVPIRKSSDWWALDHEKRTVLMLEHTEATLPYLRTIKRKCITRVDLMISILSPISRPPSWSTSTVWSWR